jgi:hypothetical protein
LKKVIEDAKKLLERLFGAGLVDLIAEILKIINKIQKLIPQ